MRRRIWRGLNMKTWKFNFRIIFPGWINCDAALATLLLVSALVHAVILWCFGMISNSHDESMRQKAYILAYLSRSYHPKRPWRVHFYMIIKVTLQRRYKNDKYSDVYENHFPRLGFACMFCRLKYAFAFFRTQSICTWINLIWTPTLTPLQSWNTF